MDKPGRHDSPEPEQATASTNAPGRHDTADSEQRWGLDLPGESRTGVVLVHDLGTTPLGLVTLAEVVNESGIRVVAPLLPGHEDFAQPGNLHGLTPPELAAAVHESARLVARDHANMLIAGCGLGGSLALTVAAELGRGESATPTSVGAVALVSAPFRAHRRRRAFAWLSRTAVGAIPGPAPDCKRPDGDEIRLEAWPGALYRLPAEVEGLAAAAARTLDVPAIVFHAREDHLVRSSDARRLVREIGSDATELVWLERSFHQIWLDYDARLVGERIARFAEAIGEPAESERRLTGPLRAS